jgi:ligand-binding SRPBCC domain-containing protein
MSKVYHFKTVQQLSITLEEAWDFFSNPANLSSITPADMDFNIISTQHGNKMYAGQLIEYKVKPVLGIPVYWMTEITHVENKKYFIDEQRFGPYSLWHHQHHFKLTATGVEMTDIIHYKIPLGWLGDIANMLFVQKKLKSIFDYRYRSVMKRFGGATREF